MRARHLAIFLILISLVTGCTTWRPHIDYDRQADFRNYAAFAWIDDEPWIRPRDMAESRISPLNIRRIEQAIFAELTGKGYRFAQGDDRADFVVSFTVGARDKIDVHSYPTVYHGPWFNGWPYAYPEHVEVGTHTEGTLAIDIFDARSRAPVWHGSVTKRITSSDVDNAEPLIREVVAAILVSLPPDAPTN